MIMSSSYATSNVPAKLPANGKAINKKSVVLGNVSSDSRATTDESKDHSGAAENTCRCVVPTECREPKGVANKKEVY
jgi:hypothetical protein